MNNDSSFYYLEVKKQYEVVKKSTKIDNKNLSIMLSKKYFT